MKIELLKCVTRNYAYTEKPTAHVGWVHVNLADKLELWLTVLVSKKGNLYLRYPSVKVRDEFQPAVHWTSSDMLKNIQDAVMAKMMDKFELPS